MLKLSFTEQEIEALHFERFHHPHPRVQQRMEALWLKSQGLPHKEIAQLTGISENTLRSYFAAWLEGGVEQLKVLKFRRPKSALMDHFGTLEDYFLENPPSSANEALAKIEALTGIRRSPTQVRNFLKQLDLRRLKVGCLPAKADPKQQREFEKKMLEPRLKEAQAGRRVVLFVDAAHFVFGPFLGYLWSCVRFWVKAPSGRQRFNLLAALNAVSHELTIISNETHINSASVCELLHAIARRYVGQSVTLVLDNARYQRCRLVQDLAEQLQIELLFLPPYSPNLNLIERFWKFVKKRCLYSQFYADFPAFTNAILNCAKTSHTTHKQELASLLVAVHSVTFWRFSGHFKINSTAIWANGANKLILIWPISATSVRE